MSALGSTLRLMGRQTCFSFLLLIGLPCFVGKSAVAQSIVPANDNTATIVTPEGQQINISGGTLSEDGKNLFHSFEKFGLDTSEIANFLSDPTIANILSRVTGGDPSIINGLLKVSGGNANLFLMNPSGIVFGSNAQLDLTGSFAATTATGIEFEDGIFQGVGSNQYKSLTQNPTAFRFEQALVSPIINAGDLAVRAGETLSLTGGTVVNTGSLTTAGGDIAITAVPGESRVKITQQGRILSLEVPVPQADNGEPLAIRPLDLPQLLTRGEGLETGMEITAQESVQLSESGVVIPDQAGAIVSGDLNTANLDPNGTGGLIQILGTQVGLVDATVNSSGEAGGGTILIGGDYKGEGSVPNASQTLVNADSILNASAFKKGDGGTVIIWSDEATQFAGTIQAQGGRLEGNGGFVETSSQENLELLGGSVSAGAVNGKAGEWLLDPRNVRIVAGNGDNSELTSFVPTTDNEVVENGAIQEALNQNTNVTITTGNTGEQVGNITVEADIAKTEGDSPTTLTLQAANNIIVFDDIFIGSLNDQGSLNVTLNSDRDSSGRGAINIGSGASIISNGGDVVLGGGNNPSQSPAVGTPNLITGVLVEGTIDSGGGNISIRGRGFEGANEEGEPDGVDIQNETLNENAQILAKGGDISINGMGGGDGTSSNVRGIQIEEASVIATTDDGTITLEGSAGNGVDDNIGIFMGNSSSISTEDGAITLQGNGSLVTTGSGNRGINLQDSSEIVASGSGEISLEGTGGNGVDSNIGLFVDTSSVITTNNGTITLQGEGSSETTGSNNRGINLQNNSEVLISGSGEITLEGIGGNGVDGNIGIFLDTSASIRTQEANIALQGESPSDTTGVGNRGINLQSGSEIIASGEGGINLDGSGGSGIGSNTGIAISSSTALRTENGDINLQGQGGSGDSDNDGIIITGNTDISASGTGTISLAGTSGENSLDSSNTAGLFLSASSISIVDGVINLLGQDGQGGSSDNGIIISNNTELSASGTGTINLQGQGSEQATTDSLRISEDSIFNAPLTIQAANGVIEGSITGSDSIIINEASESPLTDNDGITELSADLETAEAIIINDEIILSDNLTLIGGRITFNETIDSDDPDTPRSLTLNTVNNGLTTFAGEVGTQAPLNRLELNADGETQINGAVITTTEDQIYNNLVILGADTTLNGNNITFDASIESNNNLTNLTLNAEGSIIGQNIDTSATGDGGNVTLNANTGITTGIITTASETSKGGNVTLQNEVTGLDDDTSNDIEVTAIDATGNNEGGIITVFTEQLFRATDTIDGTNSITTSNGSPIAINHGGQGIIPFEVGQSNLESGNGTLGAVTNTVDSEIRDQSFPFTFEENNIAFISVSEPEVEENEDDFGVSTPLEIAARESNLENKGEKPLTGSETVATPAANRLQPIGLPESQQVLTQIEQASGVKPAFIYVRFTSVTDAIGQTEVVEQQEANSLLEDLEAESLTPYANYYDSIDAPPFVTTAPEATDQMEIVIVTGDNEVTRTVVPNVQREDFKEIGFQLRDEVLLNQYGAIVRSLKMREQTHLESAQRLYDWMIRPIEEQLEQQEIENLVFVLPTELRLIPLAALHDGEQYLVQKGYSVGLAPAVSMVNGQYKPMQEVDLLAMGTSEFPEIEGMIAESDLPSVPIELEQIVEQWGGVKFAQEEFSIEQFNRVRQQNPYGIVHLATHANFTQDEPGSSYVRFYNDALRLDQVKTLNLKDIELLTLSACRTVFGDENSELGFAGLAYQAGVKSVLGSLWKVDDAGTLAFMTQFYDELNDEETTIKAEGVREAQVDMIEGRVRLEGNQIITETETINLPIQPAPTDLSHPYFWSAFTMVGSPW